MEDLTLEQLRIFELTNHAILHFVISAFGIGANAINIVVFLKQGFEETVNISLLGLAVSDLASVFFMLCQSILFNPLISGNPDLMPFNYLELQYVTTGWPHQLFVRITSLITVFVTLERCLCVMLPLKVKTIFNTRTTSAVIILIYVGSAVSISPVFYALKFEGIYDIGRNKSMFSLRFRENGLQIENAVFTSNQVVIYFSIIGVITCTLLLVKTLLSKSKWRKTATSGVQSQQLENKQSREMRVIKMVVFIAALYIFCYSFMALAFALMVSIEDFSVTGKYKNMFQATWSILNVFACLNSSVNIFVYIKMSSRYRDIFLQIFCCKAQK